MFIVSSKSSQNTRESDQSLAANPGQTPRRVIGQKADGYNSDGALMPNEKVVDREELVSRSKQINGEGQSGRKCFTPGGGNTVVSIRERNSIYGAFNFKNPDMKILNKTHQQQPQLNGVDRINSVETYEDTDENESQNTQKQQQNVNGERKIRFLDSDSPGLSFFCSDCNFFLDFLRNFLNSRTANRFVNV